MSDPIVPFPKFGAGIGLHRVAAIAADLNLDLARFGANGCVVTGSNGKGSVAAMTVSMLAAPGARVGRFTSPHLFSIRERFALNGADISLGALNLHWARVLQACRRYEAGQPEDKIGGFEFLFLVAADWFAAERCDYTVWEAGIGGRYDPTRLVRPRRTALVSLDLEHTALLGSTLEEIAFDKLDAAPQGARVFIGETALSGRIRSYCALRGVEPVFVTNNSHHAAPLAGPHQRGNTAIAIALAQDMAPLSSEAITAGLAATSWPGRLETINATPPIVIDVGHTPEAIRLARAGFEAMHAPAVLVCGASIDKPSDAIVRQLAPGFRAIICAAARHKGRPADEIAALARAANSSAEIISAPDMASAHAAAMKLAGRDAIYVAGGLFLAAEFKAVHQGRDPATLHFF